MQAASPYATGAGGSDFERRVDTAFVCYALAGVPIPPLVRPPGRIRLQAGHLNCGFDDLVLETLEGGKPERRLFVSAKSTINPRASDREFRGVISKAWRDWQSGATFDRDQDSFLLVAARSRSPRIHLLERLTETARASGDQADFEHRLSLEGYIDSSVRQLLPEIAGIIEEETRAAPDNEALRQFLCRLFVSTYDFDQDASQDKARVVGILRLASESRDQRTADSCWHAVFEEVSMGDGRAKVFGEGEFEFIARQHELKRDVPARTASWLANLRAHCRTTRGGITSVLSVNQRHIPRQRLVMNLRKALSTNQFALVAGPPGSGKSGLAIEVAETITRPENVFCFQSEELAHAHLDAALQAGGLRDLNAEEWSDALPLEPRVLVIEALERLLQTSGSREALTQLLRVVAADRRWHVIVTCRDYLGDHIRDTWAVPDGWSVVRVPLLEPVELDVAIADSGIPAIWLAQPAIRDALRNLKWLDLTMRAAQRIRGTVPASAWATLADWRDFVWRQLLSPEIDSRGQELLIRIGIQRATSGSPWAEVEEASLAIADQLMAQGILRKRDSFSNRYRPEHDVLEDWALLFYVRRKFAHHGQQPAELFAQLGSGLMVRRAFRQFLGELLESGERSDGVSFIRRTLTDASCGKEWREEVVNALLGSSCAAAALNQTRDLWLDAAGDGLRMLCHVLRIAYLGKPRQDGEPELPFGPGWDATMTFIWAQGDPFLREHTRAVVALLLDWHHAVTPDCHAPRGLAAAAALVRGLWQIAIEGEESFEKYWADDEGHHLSASENRLCWLVGSVAGALDSAFFREVGHRAFGNRDRGGPAGYAEADRQSRELAEFLVSDYAGWALARAHPRTMARFCLQAYGLRKQPDDGRGRRLGRPRSCGLTADRHDFSPPSALRGPFLELLSQHSRLGEALILRLVNEATSRWVGEPDTPVLWEQPIELALTIEGSTFTQVADQGWWRCYRGWSPYPHVIECALMALEKWLLEDVGARDPENLQTTLLNLVARSHNVAVTAVAASVGSVHWWRCGKLAAVLLGCWPFLRFDLNRWMNDKSHGGWTGGWPERHSSYLKERRESNALPHRLEHLEHFIVRAQLGPGRSEIWPVLDGLNAELAAVPSEQVTDEVQTARLVLHRIDSRHLRARRYDDKDPGQVLLQTGPPSPELQAYLKESAKQMEAGYLPMELVAWAAQVLEPVGSTHIEPQRWREMLEKARKFDTMQVDPDRMLVFGNTPVMVAAVCLRDFADELNRDELEWCMAQVTRILAQQSDLTQWQPGSMLTSWQAECGAACACGVLSATRPAKVGQMTAIDEATAIALTHPEKRVRFAAAEGLGRVASASTIQLSACELLISHARVCRGVDLRHRGPQRLACAHIQNWQDRRSEMHLEILAETRRLRARFVKGADPDLRRLALLYPRGEEEDEAVPAIVAALLRHGSATALAALARVRNWLAIQFIDNSARRHRHRRFAADTWRDHYGSSSRGDPVNISEAGHLLARRVLSMTPAEAREFYAPIFRPGRLCHLRGEAGVFLKHLCLALDAGGHRAVFWAAWEGCALAAVELGRRLNDREHWLRLKTSPEAAAQAFRALVSALFLNRMNFRPDEHWPPLDGELDRFSNAFRTFHAVALDAYVAFLDTVGGALLPAAWRGVSDCLCGLIKRTGRSFLTADSDARLLRLLAREASLHRIPDEDQRTWRAILHLLDILTDAGSPEAFRLREGVARFAA